MPRRHANGRFKKGKARSKKPRSARSKKGGGAFDFIHKPGTKFKFQPQKLPKDISGQAEAQIKAQVMTQVRRKMEQYGIPPEVIPYVLESQALFNQYKASKKKN